MKIYAVKNDLSFKSNENEKNEVKKPNWNYLAYPIPGVFQMLEGNKKEGAGLLAGFIITFGGIIANNFKFLKANFNKNIGAMLNETEKMIKSKGRLAANIALTVGFMGINIAHGISMHKASKKNAGNVPKK